MTVDSSRLESYAKAALENACQEISGSAQSARNLTLNHAAFGIGQLVGGGLIDYQQAYLALYYAAIGTGLPTNEAIATTESGLSAGILNPRAPEDKNGKNTVTQKSAERTVDNEIPKRPPHTEIKYLWQRSQRLTLPSRVDKFLKIRGINSRDVGYLDVARAFPHYGLFFKWWPQSWVKHYALIVQAFEPDGTLASIHGRAIDDVGDGPKTRWPAGFQAKGLLFADERGQALLQCMPIVLLHGVLIVEGLTDFLKASIWAAIRETRRHEGIAVFGITAGGASALNKVRWQMNNVPAFIATDDDAVGEKYAAAIHQALPASMPVKRILLGGLHE